jgi:HK97 family phage portal protein
MTLSGVYSAVTAIATSLAAVEPQVVQSLATGGLRRVTDIDAARALSDWPFDEREGFIIDAIVGGNGYAIIRRNQRGGAYRLQWVPSWRVMVSADDDTNEIAYIVKPDAAVLAEDEEIIPQRDMVHLKFRLTGRHPYLGVSPLVTGAPALGYSLAIRKVGSRLFSNFSLPVTILQHPKTLSLDATTRLKQSYLAATTGDKIGQAVVLAENMTVAQTSPAKAVDLQVEQLSRLSVAEAGRLLGVPLSYLNEPGSINFSTSVEEARNFVRNTLSPWSIRLADALSRALISRDDRLAGLCVSIDLAPLVRGSGVELAEMASKIANSGVLSVNEVRSWFNAGPVPGGDEVRAPANTMPISDWTTYYSKPEPEPEPEPKRRGLFK